MAEFKRNTIFERERLQVLTDAVREYLKAIEVPYYGRHRKTTMTFVGDRFKPEEITCRFIKPKIQI